MSDWARIDPVALDRWLTTPPEDESEYKHEYSDERLEQIRERLANHEQAYENDWNIPDALHDYTCDVSWLLDELDRLRKQQTPEQAQGSVYAANADLYRQE